MSLGFGPTKENKKGSRKKADTTKRRLKLYATAILNGSSKKEAALLAGFKLSIAENALQKIERPNAEYFQKLADSFIPDELMMMKVRQGLDATTVKTASHEGEITDEREYADFQTRAVYIKLAGEFKGRLQRAGGDVNVNMPITLVHSIPRPVLNGSNGSNGNNR